MDPQSVVVFGGLGIAAGCTALSLGRKYISHRYWSKIGVRNIRPFPVSEAMWSNYLGPDIATLEKELHKNMGPIFGIYLKGKPMLSVADPKVLRDILGNSKVFPIRRPMDNNDEVLDSVLINCAGARRDRVASAITPGFGVKYVQMATETMASATQNLIHKLEKVEPEGRPVDVKRYFEDFVVEVILRAVFSLQTVSQYEIDKYVSNARAIFQGKFSMKEVMQTMAPSLLLKPVAKWVIEGSPIKFFKDFAVKVVQDRIESGTRVEDYLQVLIDANSRLKDLQGTEGSKTQNYLTNSEMLGQCIIFFLGGFGTTVGTLSFTAFELAANPDVQEKLIKEIDETIKTKGELGYQTLREMVFLNSVVTETLRKYPVIRTDRVAACDYTIEDYNITVPKGMIVSAPVYALHHDPKLYPDPEKFIPDRFVQNMGKPPPQLTFLSFGYGLRSCFGRNFARTEMLVCLSNLLRQVRFRLSQETHIPLKFNYGQDVLSPKEVKLRIEFRKDNVNSKQA